MWKSEVLDVFLSHSPHYFLGESLTGPKISQLTRLAANSLSPCLPVCGVQAHYDQLLL